MKDSLVINEIFHSIQGESTWAGLPCTFIRLTGCHLRCGYCDTEYAFHEGRRMSLDAIATTVAGLRPTPLPGREGMGEGRTSTDDQRSDNGQRAKASPSPSPSLRGRGGGAKQPALVEITGGEPLLQPNVHPLITRLADLGYTVLVETSGACDISRCDPRVIRIMDLKTPGSGEADRNDWANIDRLTERDEVKFVLTGREDYEWMVDVLDKHDLADRVNAVLVSAVHEMPAGAELPGATGLPLRDLAEWVLAAGLPVRLQTQLHKLIWDPTARGV